MAYSRAVVADLATACRRRPAANQRVLLVLDEVQKIQGWSEVVKRLWDLSRWLYFGGYPGAAALSRVVQR